MSSYVKQHGFVECGSGSKLVQYLCVNNDVSGALVLVNKLKEQDLFVSFPFDVLLDLSRQGRMVDAYTFVMGAKDSLPVMDVVEYSIIIDSLCKEGFIDKALDLCVLARKKGVFLNVVTYNMILNGLCRQGCLVEAFRLFDSLERNSVVATEVTYGTMIDALVREGYLLDARQLFERMVLKDLKPTTHIYNALINGYCKIGDVEESLKLLEDLEIRSFKPDEFTVSAVIDGFCRQGNMEGALQFFIHVREKESSPDYLGFLYLIRGLFTKGRMEEARTILREMLLTETSVELINRIDVEIESESIYSFLVHLCEQGSVQEAVIILNEIGAILFPYKRSVIQQGLAQEVHMPDEVSFKPLSFTNEMSLDESATNLNEVEEEEILCNESGDLTHTLDFDTFYTEVEALCSNGDLAEASKLTKEMIHGLSKERV